MLCHACWIKTLPKHFPGPFFCFCDIVALAGQWPEEIITAKTSWTWNAGCMPVVSRGSVRSVRLTAPDQLSSFLCWVEGNAPSDQQVQGTFPAGLQGSCYCSGLELLTHLQSSFSFILNTEEHRSIPSPSLAAQTRLLPAED